MLIANSEQGLLPSEYQRVEYIKTTDDLLSKNPYINSMVVPTNNTGVNIIYKSNAYTATQYIVGTRDYSGGAITYGINGSSSPVNGTYLWDIYVNGNRYLGTKSRGTYKVQSSLMPTNGGGFEWNFKNLDSGIEETIITSPTTINVNTTILLFGFNANNTVPNLEIYECQIFESGVMIRNFIPCYRKSDGVAGMYDLVDGIFYTTSRNEFIKGDDV
jgi:hypothetical protein